MTMPLILPAPADTAWSASGAPGAAPAGPSTDEAPVAPDEHGFAAVFAAMLAPAPVPTPVATEVAAAGPATDGTVEAPGVTATGDPAPSVPTATIGSPTDRPAGLSVPTAEPTTAGAPEAGAPEAGAATTVEATAAATADLPTEVAPADAGAGAGVGATTPLDDAPAAESAPTEVPADATVVPSADSTTADTATIDTAGGADTIPAVPADASTTQADTTGGDPAGGDTAGNPGAPQTPDANVDGVPAPALATSAVGPNRIDPAPATTTTTTVAAPIPTPAAATAEQVVSVIAPLRDTADGAHRISLSLRPAELGTLELDVRIVDGVVHLGLRADDARTADLLRQALAELRSTLDEAGLTTGSLTVADHQVGHGRPDADRDATPGTNRSTTGRNAPGTDAVDASPTTRPIRNDVGLDVLL